MVSRQIAGRHSGAYEGVALAKDEREKEREREGWRLAGGRVNSRM